MPTKRLSPSSDTHDVVDMPLKKTQRTHEENQERAYIAASRRADRDIEHRIRSALKASECRRKRTGRGLKITREAVVGDEQYESEDDDHASRRFSMPAATNTAASSISNPCVQSPGRVADRYAEIDALFAKHFPHVQLSSQWSRQHQTTHRYSNSQPSMGLRAQSHPVGYGPRLQQQQQQQQQQPHQYQHQHQHQPHPNSPVEIPVLFPDAFSNTAMTTTATATTLPTAPSPATTTAALTSSSSCASSPALLTPPVSYPLPPAACGSSGEAAESPTAKSGSMSPLVLEKPHSSSSPSPSSSSSSSSRPGSAFSAAAQHATVGLGLANGYFQQQQQQQQQQQLAAAAAGGSGSDLDSHDGAATGLSCFDGVGFSAELGAGDPLWYSGGDRGGPGTAATATLAAPAQAGWQSRSLSLPSALKQFQFFPAFEPASIGEDELSDMLIDPGILPSGSGGSASAPVDGFDAGAPGEPWADWVNLDGDAPAPLGVEL
ncbi:hypothetical protein VTH06DRAFT_5488 [Thermothelomyces fergusii]